MDSADPRERRWYRKRAQLKQAFYSAGNSFDKMLKQFKKMEKSGLFKQHELGLEYWALTRQLDLENQQPEKIVSFGKKALEICIQIDNTNSHHFRANSTLAIACTLYMLGSASYKLKRFNESLSYLNWSERNFVRLELDNNVPLGTVLYESKKTHQELFKVKTDLRMFDEAVRHAIKVLEIEEKTMEEGCLKIGMSNMEVAEAYVGVLNWKKALPFALKGIGIYEKYLDHESMALVHSRWFLVIIYSGLEEFEKAWEQNLLCRSVFEMMDFSSDFWIHVEMETAHILLGMGRFEEGMDAFNAVISQAGKQGAVDVKLGAFASMARACYREKKPADAKKYIKLAKRILEKKQISQSVASSGLLDLSKLCEEMEDFRTAIAMLLRALVLPEFPKGHLICCSSRLFSMLSLSGCKEEQGISQLEDVVEMLKEKLGSEHSQVGYGYESLATAYMHSGEPGKAEKCFLRGKDILDASLGANHVHKLATCQSLSTTYADTKRFDLAIEIKEKVVEDCEGLGPNEQDKLDVAVELLQVMKVDAIGNDFPAKKSKCGLPKDGK